MPPILAASFAGPFGKSSYSSLTGTPDSLPSERIDGAVPGGQEAVAHEPDDEPVTLGQLRDAAQVRDLLGDLVGPLLGVEQESLRVDLDGGVGNHHLSSSLSLLQAAAGRCLPAVGIVGPIPG